jgi:hypothetical protein
MASRVKIGRHIHALETGDVPRRREAAKKLGKTGSREAVEPLCAALADESWFVRRNAARALGRIGDAEAVAPLIAVLGDKSKGVRREAVIALGKVGDARAVAPLSQALRDRDIDVGRDAITSLLQIGPPAIALLCQTLASPHPDGNGNAAIALRRMLDRMEGSPLLLSILAEPQLTPAQRWIALETLRGHPRGFFAAPYLTDIRRFCERILHLEESAPVRAGAQGVLEYMTLGRASQQSATTGKSYLLRAAAGSSLPVPPETLLRASEETTPSPPDFPPPDAKRRTPLSSLRAGMRRLLRRQ